MEVLRFRSRDSDQQTMTVGLRRLYRPHPPPSISSHVSMKTPTCHRGNSGTCARVCVCVAVWRVSKGYPWCTGPAHTMVAISAHTEAILTWLCVIRGKGRGLAGGSRDIARPIYPLCDRPAGVSNTPTEMDLLCVVIYRSMFGLGWRQHNNSELLILVDKSIF